MIIRPACGRSYTALPNAIWNDRRLSAETRTMIALTLSKSENWKVRPVPLAKALSREGARPIGRTKLARMFQEAMAAGYMARSEKQTHQNDGLWGPYTYFVGMPEDVAAAVAGAGVAILPHAGLPHTADPHTADPHTANRRTDQKVKSPQNTDSQKTPTYHPPFPAAGADTSRQAADDGLSNFGRAAREAGCSFVWEGSEPFKAWLAFRGEDGMPPPDVAIVDGVRRHGVWLPTLYPPKVHAREGAE